MIGRLLSAVRRAVAAVRAALSRVRAALAPPPADDEQPISVIWSEPAEPIPPLDSTPVTAPAIPRRMPQRKPRI